MPSIFVDIARLVLIVTGLALLFSWVWGANVAGLFAALGVTSIMLGFALQNAVGSIISGLLLLFEQPFRLGDWLDTGSTKGRVVEVNWRAVHIETGNGVQIIPNATLGRGVVQQPQPTGRLPRRDRADDASLPRIRPTSCVPCSTGSPGTCPLPGSSRRRRRR